MSAPRHHYALEASYGPAELFRDITQVCERAPKNSAATFNFDWLKRKVVLSTADGAAVAKLSKALIACVARAAGDGHLLAGAAVEVDGRHSIPIGVLLQTPDVYTEMIVGLLYEMGIKDVHTDEDGAGFSVGLGKKTTALGYEDIVSSFPLPEYLKLVDRGVR